MSGRRSREGRKAPRAVDVSPSALDDEADAARYLRSFLSPQDYEDLTARERPQRLSVGGTTDEERPVRVRKEDPVSHARTCHSHAGEQHRAFEGFSTESCSCMHL